MSHEAEGFTFRHRVEKDEINNVSERRDREVGSGVSPFLYVWMATVVGGIHTSLSETKLSNLNLLCYPQSIVFNIIRFFGEIKNVSHICSYIYEYMHQEQKKSLFIVSVSTRILNVLHTEHIIKPYKTNNIGNIPPKYLL